MGKWTDAVLRVRPILQRVAVDLDDADASVIVGLYDGMKYDDSLIKAGTRIDWNGTLKRAVVDLWDTEQNNPDNAPTLWADIAYHDGIRIIPAVITAEQAFALDELGWQDGKVYRSKMHGNVFPVTQADAWEFVR